MIKDMRLIIMEVLENKEEIKLTFETTISTEDFDSEEWIDRFDKITKANFLE